MRQYSTLYIIGFSAAVCIVCSLLVSTAAVALKDDQEANIVLDRQQNVLSAAGLIAPGEFVGAEQVAELFKKMQPVVVDLQAGKELPDVDASIFDQRKVTKSAGIARLPKQALVYKLVEDGRLKELILPIEGKGLWSTLYGFLALEADGRTVCGITFYQHGETPGLGGEIDNPKWKALWKGRKAYDEDWAPKIEVIKGYAGKVEEDPYRIDGLSGATLTSRGVSYLVQFWLGENGFGPYLQNLRESGVLQGG